MSLHLKIAEARKIKGLTQEEVADRANITVRTIQRIESGETVPRNFTLKAIAQVLDIPFEDLVSKDNQTSFISRESETEEAIHFLQLLNLSCFSYILVPYIHFLIPMSILRKRKELNMKVLSLGRRIIQRQVIWVVTTQLLLLLTVVYNILVVPRLGLSDPKKAYIHYLWVVIVMYFLNAVIILVTYSRTRSRLTQ